MSSFFIQGSALFRVQFLQAPLYNINNKELNDIVQIYNNSLNFINF
jgi:hypothetical protein